MQFKRLSIPDVILIEPKVFGDQRGYFVETWQQRIFSEAGIDADFVQDNLSKSTRHTLRGLHYQLKQPQGKLVRVISGIVYDVAVDIRRSSPTYGKWVGALLSEENQHGLWVPPGFAHGFVVLSDSASFIYKCTDFYAPQFERTIQWNDPDIAIQWPLAEYVVPILSSKDTHGVSFRDAETYP